MNILGKSLFVIIFILNTIAIASSDTFTKEELNYIKNKKIKIGMLPDFYPFAFKKDNKLTGYSYDLIKIMAKKSNLNVEFVVDNWPNNFHKFNNNKIDVLDAVSLTKERLKYINYTNPYFDIPLVLYGAKNITQYDGTIQSLEKLKLGLIKDIFSNEEIESLNIFDISYYASSEQRLNALITGKIDLSIGSFLSIQRYIRENNMSNVKIIDELNSLLKEDLRIGTKKSNPLLSSIIEKSYNQLSFNDITKLKEKWFSEYPKVYKDNYTNRVKLTEDELNYLKNINEIKMCNSKSYAPVEFVNEKGEVSGISIDTLKLVEKKLGNRIKFVSIINKDNTDELFIQGVCDILPLAIPRKSDTKYLFTDNYLTYEGALITRDDKPFINSIEDVKYKGIALKDDSKVISHISKMYKGINITRTKTIKESFSKVSSGEVYATMSLLPIASYHITKYGYSNLKIAGHSKEVIKFKIAIRGDNKILLSIINKGLNAITQKEKSIIFNKWANIKYAKDIDYGKVINIILIAVFIIILLVYRQYMLGKNNNKLQKAKEKLEESNNHFKTIFEASIQSIFITNEDRVIVEANRMCTKLF